MGAAIMGFTIEPEAATPKRGFTIAPAETEAPSNTAVLANALWKGAASVPDAVLNTPQNLVNLGRAAIGSITNAVGRPDLSPDIVPTADIARRGAEKVGLINPNVVPQGPFQKAIDLLGQGAVGGALTGGGGAGSLVGAGMGALSAGAAGATEAVTGRPALGAIAGMVAPSAAMKVPSIAEASARRLMQSALKPTLADLKSGDAQRAISTNLAEGINVTAGGVDKLQNKIAALNDERSARIAGSQATVDKRAAMGPLQDTRGTFSNQVDPHANLAAIERVRAGFDNTALMSGM